MPSAAVRTFVVEAGMVAGAVAAKRSCENVETVLVSRAGGSRRAVLVFTINAFVGGVQVPKAEAWATLVATILGHSADNWPVTALGYTATYDEWIRRSVSATASIC